MTENLVQLTEVPLLVITGPTASGKTELALELAQCIPIEVISADSRQVYRHMDIGTAKPSREQQSRVTHHGIDIVEPDKPFSAYDFVGVARKALNTIRARGQIPVVVGGTGFYIKALIEGSPLGGVPPDPVLRAELQQLVATKGPESLIEYLRRIDPDRASTLDKNNHQRVIRAIEIARRPPQTDLEPQFKQLAYQILGVSVPPAELAHRITARGERMYSGGLLAEVDRLLGMGFDPDLPALSGIGYGEAIDHLHKGLSLDLARARTIARTRQLARRQRTWFRHQLPVNWHLRSDAIRAALAYLEHLPSA